MKTNQVVCCALHPALPHLLIVCAASAATEACAITVLVRMMYAITVYCLDDVCHHCLWWGLSVPSLSVVRIMWAITVCGEDDVCHHCLHHPHIYMARMMYVIIVCIILIILCASLEEETFFFHGARKSMYIPVTFVTEASVGFLQVLHVICSSIGHDSLSLTYQCINTLSSS